MENNSNKKEATNIFVGGIDSDTSIQLLDNTTYRNAKNILSNNFSYGSGCSGSITNILDIDAISDAFTTARYFLYGFSTTNGKFLDKTYVKMLFSDSDYVCYISFQVYEFTGNSNNIVIQIFTLNASNKIDVLYTSIVKYSTSIGSNNVLDFLYQNVFACASGRFVIYSIQGYTYDILLIEYLVQGKYVNSKGPNDQIVSKYVNVNTSNESIVCKVVRLDEADNNKKVTIMSGIRQFAVRLVRKDKLASSL